MTALSANQLLGDQRGVRRGWRPARLSEIDVHEFLLGVPWLVTSRRGQMVAFRGWKQRGRGLRRVDVAFADGSRVSVRRFIGRVSTQLSRWR